MTSTDYFHHYLFGLEAQTSRQIGGERPAALRHGAAGWAQLQNKIFALGKAHNALLFFSLMRNVARNI